MRTPLHFTVCCTEKTRGLYAPNLKSAGAGFMSYRAKCEDKAAVGLRKQITLYGKEARGKKKQELSADTAHLASIAKPN